MKENKNNINCEKTMYKNFHSSLWKYWIFNIEIFTFFIKGVKTYG